MATIISFENPRLKREAQTICIMVELACQEQHHTQTGQLCADCSEIRNYALMRLQRCPFQEKKPACAQCTVHCYKKEMRQRIRGVMRIAGPKMLLHHPLLALLHLLDGLRPTPKLAS